MNERLRNVNLLLAHLFVRARESDRKRFILFLRYSVERINVTHFHSSHELLYLFTQLNSFACFQNSFGKTSKLIANNSIRVSGKHCLCLAEISCRQFIRAFFFSATQLFAREITCLRIPAHFLPMLFHEPSISHDL
jgi:hypothetical protein